MRNTSMGKTGKKACGLLALVIVLSAFLTSCATQTSGGPPKPAASATPSAHAPAEAPDGAAPDGTSQFFEGDWARTGVIRYAAAALTITEETEKEFYFILTAYGGDHMGELAGRAEKRSCKEAVCILNTSALHNGGTLRFLFSGSGELSLSFEGDINALDFGQNVLPAGLYVKGEPEYESDGYPMLVFGGEALREKTMALMTDSTGLGDDTAYDNLIDVMREGLPELVGPGRYRGFMTPRREKGADLYISPDGHIYLMAYGLDNQPYVFYTTDIRYHGWLQFPEYLELPENFDPEKVIFAYNGYDG